MKSRSHFRAILFSTIFLVILIAPKISFAQASCATAQTLTPAVTCVTTAGDLQNAVNAAPTGACGGATATTTNGVWYKFTATSKNATITVGGLGSNLTTTTTYLEVLSGTCSTSFTSISCQNVATATNLTTLTAGTVYYVRVYVTTATTSSPGNRRGFTICIQSSPDDDCASAISLTSGVTCSTITGSLLLSTATAGLPVGCEAAGTHYDVWYKFVAANTTQTVTISNRGAQFTNPEIQLYSGACGSLTSVICGTTTFTATGLTIGNTYYVRVSNIGSAPTSTGNFDICVTHPALPPANDDCSSAITISTAVSCSNTTGTINGATASTGLPVGCESAGTHYDVWYKYVATQTYESITISGLGANLTSPEIQLYSGSCGALTSLFCGTTTLTATGLTVGNTYYLRVSNIGTAISANGGFSLCAYHPAPGNVDFGKSYVNISKNSGGGTISPGDTLEIRGTLVIRSNTIDSIAFIDTLYNGGGTRLIPGSIILRTNEGKVYKSFTDAFDSDAGYYYTSGLDTVIRINIGLGASATARGRLSNTSRPSVFGSTCIIMATYRVVVYNPYNTTISVGGGLFTTKDATTGISSNLNLSRRNAIVYSSPGLCPNAVSATNAIGGDFNGTFGTPAVSAPLARNRGTSTNVPSYIYKTFAPGAGPNDYYYGIANNTSATFTTLTTLVKPDTKRVFSVWDITGDHTGATNTSKGNIPCDTTKPVSATNPCGYMLVINSAYKTDTAFTYTTTNLCPNTYYEISAWVKNICSKCSCDSTGTGAQNAGYIPFATGDSSGVQPNLAFDIDGTDYYTTGNIVHYGVTANQMGSDSTNKWVKRGFTILTGPSQSSITLSIRNNAPGGGGNDWALDDITFATCLPNMSYSPTLNPTVCDSNTITLTDTVRSYFNNYVNYKWQRYTAATGTWNDIAGTTGVGTPAWNGSAWEYIATYTVPPTETYMVNNGDLYRLIVATTASNLASTGCQVTDGVSIVSLNVIDCDGVLASDLLSFNGRLVSDKANLTWTMSKENEPLTFTIERSRDGINFVTAGTMPGSSNTAEIKNYSFIDPIPVSGKVWYRVVISNSTNKKKYSTVILLKAGVGAFELTNVQNPFNGTLNFDINSNESSHITAELLDANGTSVRKNDYLVYPGVNSLSMINTTMLPTGVYTLRIINKQTVLARQVLKLK